MSELAERAGTLYVLLVVSLLCLVHVAFALRRGRRRPWHQAACSGILSLAAGLFAFREPLGRELAASPAVGVFWVLALSLGFTVVGLAGGGALAAWRQAVAAWRRP